MSALKMIWDNGMMQSRTEIERFREDIQQDSPVFRRMTGYMDSLDVKRLRKNLASYCKTHDMGSSLPERRALDQDQDVESARAAQAQILQWTEGKVHKASLSELIKFEDNLLLLKRRDRKFPYFRATHDALGARHTHRRHKHTDDTLSHTGRR